MSNPNPLVDQHGLPPFSRIRPEHVGPAVDQVLTENRRLIDELLAAPGPLTWASLVEPLILAEDRLGRVWSPVRHLSAVMNSEPLRAAYQACEPAVSGYYTELGQNRALEQAYRQLLDTEPGLDAAQRKCLTDALLDFHLSGVDLPPTEQARFKAISIELAELATRFANHCLDATKAWTKQVTDEARLAGLPESALQLARQNARDRDLDGWVLTLDFPCYLPVMTYADDRELRREVYEAFTTRASDQGPQAGQFDNTELMERMLALRHEGARLLGFDNFAEQSLARKMAPSTDEVMRFLRELGARARPRAQAELDEVRAFARAECGLDDLQAWDLGYFSERLRQRRFNISQEELRPYFPIRQVLAGLFTIARQLFGIEIHERCDFDGWHPDVRFYEILDGSEEVRGHFYLDLHARPDKRGGAWMDSYCSRMVNRRRHQVPVAFLVCNFSPPVGERPSLLTHQEVQTLFHEFGHGLHHLLTTVDHPPVAGINGVEWDAVELPSQFLENWCWDREALRLISGHWESGAPLPDELFERMSAARNFQSALQTVRQLEFALFDFRLHREYDPGRGARVYEILDAVRDEVAVIRPPAFNRYPHSFSHIFAGGYAAGYYSYKWAEVLSADAFSLFEERGVFDAATGEAFRREVLEAGGSRPAMAYFTAFRGRPPRIDALLRHTGILDPEFTASDLQ